MGLRKENILRRCFSSLLTNDLLYLCISFQNSNGLLRCPNLSSLKKLDDKCNCLFIMKKGNCPEWFRIVFLN